MEPESTNVKRNLWITGIVALCVGILLGYGIRVLSKGTKTPLNNGITASQTSTPRADPQAIRKIDFQKYLAGIYENGTASQCATGTTKVEKTEYGDATLDGIEEAAVTYAACANDAISEVYALAYGGTPLRLTPGFDIPASFGGKDAVLKGFRRDGIYSIKNNALTFAFPLYQPKDEDASPTGGTRTVTYRWNGKEFEIQNIDTKRAAPGQTDTSDTLPMGS